MIIGILLLAASIGLILNHRWTIEREWAGAIKEIRRESCSRHEWAPDAQSGKIACIKCEFAP